MMDSVYINTTNVKSSLSQRLNRKRLPIVPKDFVFPTARMIYIVKNITQENNRFILTVLLYKVTYCLLSLIFFRL